MKLTSQKGFTLLELVVALTILATLTIFSSQSIQHALFSKIKIQTQLDEMSQVRDSLKIIERDVNLAFHYRDLEKEFREEVKKGGIAPTPTPPPGMPPPPTQPTPPPTQAEQIREQNRVDPITEFEGRDTGMDFVTLNTGRITEDQKQADFVKVGYALKPCRRLSGKQESTQCLIRRQDSLVEGDVTKGGDETVLLENVSEFKLRYFGKGQQDWNSSWSSKNGDGVTKGSFPNAVEISLTVENGEEAKKRKISMQIVAQVRFPNNKPKQPGTGGTSHSGPPPMGGD